MLWIIMGTWKPCKHCYMLIHHVSGSNSLPLELDWEESPRKQDVQIFLNTMCSQNFFWWRHPEALQTHFPQILEREWENKDWRSVRGWVPQLQCVWACWPQKFHDQFTNCRYLVDVLKVTVEVRDRSLESPRTHVGLEEAVRLLLSNEGKVLRARVRELKRNTQAALADGGSTKNALNDLVESIPEWKGINFLWP